MNTPLTVPDDLMDTIAFWECSHPHCREHSTVTMTFRNQRGHVHYCAPHGRIALLHFDVTVSQPMPCPFRHGDGTTWTDDPQERT